MGTKHDMLGTELETGEILKEIVHDDRRIESAEAFERERREHNKNGKKRVAVWIRKSVIDYEDELK